MLTYANHTDEVADGLPPFATIVVEAIAVQSVTAFWACDSTDVSVAAVNSPTTHSRDLLFMLASIRVAEERTREASLPRPDLSGQCTRPPSRPIPSSLHNAPPAGDLRPRPRGVVGSRRPR